MKDDEDEDESLVATVLVLATVIWATILAFLFVTGKLTKEKINSSSDIDWENHPHRTKLLWTPPIIAILLLLPATAKFLGFSEKHYVCDVANPEEKRHKRICSNKSFLDMYFYVRVFLFVSTLYIVDYFGHLTKGDSKKNTQYVVTSSQIK